ncbi:MAG: tRNA (adenine(22)-N(1))-methyltransferase TrmK, partial [Parasporobacterium sp.]|nr:tRNA (adenine(22)-N(1))-methyltransferase TrmK [Parasporobacterium sp.]
AIISGMGGMLMCRILEDGSETVKSLKELVLSPHRDADLVKEKVKDLGFDIAADEIFADKGKEYPVIKAVNKAFLQGI